MFCCTKRNEIAQTRNLNNWLLNYLFIQRAHSPFPTLFRIFYICLFHNNFKINMVFLTCILNIGHVTSKHITYSSHEIN